MSGRVLSNKLALQHGVKPAHMRITYLNDGILNCRVRGIYYRILKMDIQIAKEMVNDTIWSLNNAVLIDNPETVKYCTPIFYRMLVDLSLGKTQAAHDKIRTIHYYIFNKNL